MVTNSFQHEIPADGGTLQPSLSVAFVTAYRESPATAKLYKLKNFAVASVADMPITDFSTAEFQNTELPVADQSIAELPPVLEEHMITAYLNGTYDDPLPLEGGFSGASADEFSGDHHVWIGYDGEILYVLYQDPFGGYSHSSCYMTPAELGLPSALFAGFMGSIGNTGGNTTISSWSFRNDTSLLDQAIVDADHASLIANMNNKKEDEAVALYTVSSDLPMEGPYGSNITWTTSNPTVVTTGGAVTTPTLEQGDQTVDVTATITKGEAVPRTAGPYHCVVPVPDWVIVTADHAWLTESIILAENAAMDAVVSNLSLPATGFYGSDIAWSSSNAIVANWSGNVGIITRPAYPASDQPVTLTAYFTRGSSSWEKSFDITVLALGMTAVDITSADASWLTASQLLNGNGSLGEVTGDLVLPTTGQYGSSISWASDNVSAVGTDGTVTRPTHTAGDAAATLTATISKVISADPTPDTSTVTKTFPVTVRKQEQTDAEKILADMTWLTEAQLLNGNASLSQVTQNLALPTFAPSGSTLVWTTSNSEVVASNGTVTRPAYPQGDQTVTLTATLAVGSLSDTKAFTATVLKLAQTDTEKFEADQAWLTEARILNGNLSLQEIVGDLVLPAEAPNGSAISWSSNANTLVDAAGSVTRPTHTSGDAAATLSATISLNGLIVTKTFSLTVKALVQTDAEAVQAALLWLA
jgi:hypothetical protein